MFSESNWSRKSIGDVDVVYHDGLYHLFHLVLPTHDFIAHAVSDNGVNWRRVDNAIFIGDPGSWDDLMLWTMHVTPDPHQPGKWRMFYTGLSRCDQGQMQRLGLAVSDDLYRWTKVPVNWQDRRGKADPRVIQQAVADLVPQECTRIKATRDASSGYPLAPDPTYYEASYDDDRNWISFRDPFYYRENGEGWLLMAARTNHGPLVRRGCIGAMKEVAPNKFEARPPLYAPLHYDDIEVPNLFKMEGEYYLIGSIREDAKIRYWHTHRIGEPWRNYSDNVLLPTGNYAGRICHDDQGVLLWCFYTANLHDRTMGNLMPLPKRLVRTELGQLKARSYEGLDKHLLGRIDTSAIKTLKETSNEDYCQIGSDHLHLSSDAGFQAYVFREPASCFRMTARLSMIGAGKCGLLYRVNRETHDGYYLSLDLRKGIAQLRAWGTGPNRSGEHMMQFAALQTGNYYADDRHNVTIRLNVFGSYHELSINDNVVLSLADHRYDEGAFGFYVETADLHIHDLDVHHLESPTQSDEHLARG
jgi:beta-fructofuranosidase